MEFNYKKHDNTELFSTLEDKVLLNISFPQNYIPIYLKFFNLNSSNSNQVNLNNKLFITKIIIIIFFS